MSEVAYNELMPSLRLDGRVAVVTGAGRGIGREIARILAAAGAHVLVTDIDEPAARDAAGGIRGAGGSAQHHVLDVTDDSDVAAFADEAERTVGVIQILVNNAGIVTMAPFLELREEEFDAVVAVSLRGTYLMTRALLPAMRGSGWGRVISLSSMLGKTPAPYTAHYSAAKAAIIGFTQAIAKEAAPEVTVNCLCPTNVVTGIMDEDFEFFGTREGISPEDLIQRWIDAIPMGRLGQPLDVARAVADPRGRSGSIHHRPGPERQRRRRSALSGARCQVPGARCQVPGARCQVPGARCQVPGARCQVPGARCQVPGARCQVPGARCPGARCQVPGARCQVPGARCQVPGARCQVSPGARCQVPGARCQD